MECNRLCGWFKQNFELQDARHARMLPMEGLRGIAVTLVFLQHYTVQAELIGLKPGPALSFARAFRSYGNLGVELFFVLSGYLIYGALIRRRQPFLAFMRRRVQRIYPAFLAVFALALAIAALGFMPGKIPQEHWRAAAYLAANLALLPGLIPIPPVVTVAWSLSYEMFFYATTGVLVIGAGLSAATPRQRIALLLILSCAFIAGSYADIPYFPVRMMPFFAGMLLAEGVGGRVPSWAGWVMPLAGFVIYTTHVFSGTTAELCEAVAFFCLCAVCFRDAGWISVWMRSAPIRLLGNMSYSYYLIHGFIVRIAMVMLGHLLPAGMPAWTFWAFGPLLYVVTLGGAAALFLAIEKPISLRPASKQIPGVVSV